MAAPLDDVVVLEIDNWMAAPSAGAVLADMGARVIKIEPIGDPMRGMSVPSKEIGLTRHSRLRLSVRCRQSRQGVYRCRLDQPEGAALVRQLAGRHFMCNR